MELVEHMFPKQCLTNEMKLQMSGDYKGMNFNMVSLSLSPLKRLTIPLHPRWKGDET